MITKLLKQPSFIKNKSSNKNTVTNLIIGGHSGLGFDAATTLAKHGNPVIIASNNLEKIAETQANLRFQTGNKSIHAIHLDYCSLESVYTFTRSLINQNIRIGTLVNAIDFSSFDQELSVDGLEKTQAVNHFGPLLLLEQLQNQLIDHVSHVILFNSPAHRHGNIEKRRFGNQVAFNTFKAYSNAQFANATTIIHFAKLLGSRGIRINGFSPIDSTTLGPLNMSLIDHAQLYFRRYLIDHKRSSAALTRLINGETFPTQSGKLFINEKLTEFGQKAHNHAAAAIKLNQAIITKQLPQRTLNSTPPTPSIHYPISRTTKADAQQAYYSS